MNPNPERTTADFQRYDTAQNPITRNMQPLLCPATVTADMDGTYSMNQLHTSNNSLRVTIRAAIYLAYHVDP